MTAQAGGRPDPLNKKGEEMKKLTCVRCEKRILEGERHFELKNVMKGEVICVACYATVLAPFGVKEFPDGTPIPEMFRALKQRPENRP